MDSVRVLRLLCIYLGVVPVEGEMMKAPLWPYAARFTLNAATAPGVDGAEGGQSTGDHVPTGDSHYRQRQILLPAFGSSESKAQVPILRDCAHELVQEFRSRVDSESHSGGRREENTLEFLCRAILNVRPDIRAKGFGLPSNWKVFFQGVIDHVLPPSLLDTMIYLPTSGLAFYVVTSPEMDDGKDALSQIGIMNSLISTLLEAGYETAGTSLGWILFELATHLDEHQLREEVNKEIWGEGADVWRPISWNGQDHRTQRYLLAPDTAPVLAGGSREQPWNGLINEASDQALIRLQNHRRSYWNSLRALTEKATSTWIRWDPVVESEERKGNQLPFKVSLISLAGKGTRVNFKWKSHLRHDTGGYGALCTAFTCTSVTPVIQEIMGSSRAVLIMIMIHDASGRVVDRYGVSHIIGEI
ncbi:hypothetical protein EDB92DRAFT_1814077 [Lactarius akahatsu]|uniref:Uncharacterized protein n=1 Tax=Lactarius akahatsu TaxID=416441 RepID=A0AAD4LLU6_9AGAM|nr:hypothetical protein EDB92DRAFT_1814077 [Lactarius akahatsu]